MGHMPFLLLNNDKCFIILLTKYALIDLLCSSFAFYRSWIVTSVDKSSDYGNIDNDDNEGYGNDVQDIVCHKMHCVV